MAIRVGPSSVSCVASPVSSPFKPRNLQLRLLRIPYGSRPYDAHWVSDVKVRKLKRIFPIVRSTISAVPGEEPQSDELESDAAEQESFQPDSDDSLPSSSSYVQFEGSDGRPGFVSFYNRPYGRDKEALTFYPEKDQNNWQWFLGPTVLVTSFILPSLYLRRILSTIFEDSLLTDFLILFFTEALFYCGVAIFLLIIDRVRRSIAFDSADAHQRTSLQFGQRISSVATLVLSLIIPMVTMGFVWPWTGPAASAALAPYLVGIVVQFAFEQCARYKKSPSLAVIPIVFQVYRLHQLNRAAQLVTALSFTIRGAEMTSHNLAINSSLGTLLNVLQFLGLICIWSLSSFLMRFFPSTTD
ncbi:uncharacterized protein LOC116189244 isoform X2 [Punica granatum]|uniref:Uncharacterized protein LOC116189244 isoform X2 n=2 Tax=Punica granatum TaxID=22663 RepID=A0A6P8BUT5_PUNGR|nr:uncharacterized protein LOC116189244 isoform X2 [Punica granatum]